MLDESSLIQNDRSKRSDFILNKLNPDNVILLSGTPTGGKYERLWSQMKLLGWDIGKWQFINKYTENVPNKNWGGFTITGYKNVDDLKNKMHQYGARFMKTDEVYELPEQNFIEVKIAATPEYKKFEANRIVKLGNEHLVGDTSMSYRVGMRRLASIWSKPKLSRLDELIESTDDRLIIFYSYKVEFDELEKIVKKHKRPLSIINGTTKDKKAYETKPDSITLVQYQSGSMGHNLQLANKIVYFSPTDNPEHWMQSLKRIHRIGQGRPVFYYQLITENSIEGKIYDAVKNGQEYTDELFRKDYKWEGK